jgi:hypothetical protein
MRRTSSPSTVLAAGDSTGRGVHPDGSKIAGTAAPAAGDGY